MFCLRSKVAKKILTYFFFHQASRLYVNELARAVREDPMNVYRKLIELKTTGILSDEFRGNQRYFFLNVKFPLFKEYKNIIMKDIGFEKALGEHLKKIPGLKSAYLFGSYAKGKFSPGSDVDLLAVGDFDTLKFQKVIVNWQKTIGREINCLKFTPQEFDAKKKARNPLLLDIFSHKRIKIV